MKAGHSKTPGNGGLFGMVVRLSAIRTDKLTLGTRLEVLKEACSKTHGAHDQVVVVCLAWWFGYQK